MIDTLDIQEKYFEFGNLLVDLFQCDEEYFKQYDYNHINLREFYGNVSNDKFNIGYIIGQSDEMLYIYSDVEGMICYSTKSFDKNFIIVGGETYHGYEAVKKEPFAFIEKVTGNIKNYFKDVKQFKVFHI